jgi:hypothetical protein
LFEAGVFDPERFEEVPSPFRRLRSVGGGCQARPDPVDELVEMFHDAGICPAFLENLRNDVRFLLYGQKDGGENDRGKMHVFAPKEFHGFDTELYESARDFVPWI